MKTESFTQPSYLGLADFGPGFYFDPNNPTAPAPAPAPAPPAPAPAPVPAPTPPAPPAPPAPAPAPPAPPKPEPPAGETAAEKALREANERIARLEEANLKSQRRAIAAELGVKPEAVDFITATDEDGIRAQATRLKALMPADPAPAPLPGPTGTVTNPAGPPPEDLTAKIAEAEKSGNVLQAIRLKRQAAGRS